MNSEHDAPRAAGGGPAKSELALPLAQKAAQLLAERGLENARLESELLLAHVLGIKRLDLYLQHDRPLTELQLEQFRGFVRRRLKREPLQYITGHAQFRQLELKVDGRALIPRPETELLAGEVIRFVNALGRAARVVDIGTGTGAIALSIATEAPGTQVVATDVSPDALALAQENARAVGVSVEFRHGELWSVFGQNDRFDVVVSNPPYVTSTERAELQPEVREWEPGQALFAGAAGLDVIEPLVQGAPAHMAEGGMLALEVGSTQAVEVQGMIAATQAFENVRIIRDLSNRERIVTAVTRKRDQ